MKSKGVQYGSLNYLSLMWCTRFGVKHLFCIMFSACFLSLLYGLMSV